MKYIKNRDEKHVLFLIPAGVVFALCFSLSLFRAQTASAATISVPPTASLQAAINAAQPGDTLVLEAGGIYNGPITLPNKPGAQYITIQSSRLSELPPLGTRVSPSHAPLMPKIVSLGRGEGAMLTVPGAHHYKFIGVEFAPKDDQAFMYQLIAIGSTGPDQDTVEEIPHHFVFDRTYIHSFPNLGLRRGIGLQSSHSDIINSYISDFKEVGADSQAIASWNSPGPINIINNYLEGAGENVLFGGSDASIANLVPSDIVVKGNHFFKPLSWKQGHPTYAGNNWAVKNIFELKNSQRVLIEGNVFENNWAHSQSGYGILFTPRNQDGGNPWAVVKDIVFKNNVLKGSENGVNVLGIDNIHPSQRTSNIAVSNNLIRLTGEGSGKAFLAGDGPVAVVLDHNTILGTSFTDLYGSPPLSGFRFTNNIAFGYSNGESKGAGNPMYAFFTPDGVIKKNIFPSNVYVGPGSYMEDNFFPSGAENVGFVNYAQNNLRLSSSSQYKGQANDGTDVGVNFDQLEAATAGAVSGTSVSTLPSPAFVGDINKDGIVNSLDFSVLNGKWGTSDTTADLNGDGRVNALDFSAMNANWGRRS